MTSHEETHLEQEIAGLRSRLAELERREQARAARRRKLLRLLVGAALVTGLGAQMASAATGACPNGLPFCFSADAPAIASQVNNNFAQLKEWLEQKVGTSGTANVTITGTATMNGPAEVNNNVRIQAAATSNASTASGKPLFVSGNVSDGTANSGGIEFRHDNLTQGIGFGYNTIYATGTFADQALQLKARGAGTVNVLSTMAINGNLGLTGVINENQSCSDVSTGCTDEGGGNAVFLDRQSVFCGSGTYMRGFRLERCGGSTYHFVMSCCSF